jgi:hypothetical protein
VTDAHVCASCHANLWDTELAAGRRACYRCEDQAAEQLHAIRGIFKRLDSLDALTKVTAGSDSPRGASREAPAPLRIAILNQTGPGGVVTQLQSGIEDSWRKTLGWTVAPTRRHSDIDGITVFLINNLPWACERYDEIADDLKTIATIHSTLNGLETGERRPRSFAAYCNTEDCGGQMWITVKSSRATCSTCGTRYEKADIGGLRTELDPDPVQQPAA